MFNNRASRYFKSCIICEKRCPGCHSKCEEYLIEKAEYERVMDIREREHMVHATEVMNAIDRRERHRKRLKRL